MTSIILAAGKGHRIASLSGNKPKSFLTIGDKRIIDHQIDIVKQSGIDKIVVVIGYQSELFEKEYGDLGFTLLKNPFYESTNVLASLWFARDYLKDGFYFMHADSYFDSTIFEDLTQLQHPITLAVNQKPLVPEDMKVRVKEDLVLEINKEMSCESSYGEFIGLAKIDSSIAPNVIECIEDRIEKKGKINDFFESVIQDQIDEGVYVRSFSIGDRLAIEIDTPEDYELAKQLFNKYRIG